MSMVADLNMTFTKGENMKRGKIWEQKIKSGKLEIPFGIHKICCVNLDIPI